MSKIMSLIRVPTRDYMLFLLRNSMVYIWYENYFRKLITVIADLIADTDF